MPLVSGVCRTASAPTLSHGGSRLNASKPEANPKTRCPTKHTSVHTLRCCKNLVHQDSQTQHYRIATQRNTNSVGLAGAKFITKSQEIPELIFGDTSATFEKTCVRYKQNQNYVPLQTREHAWAGIDGMPWRTPGLEGHLTSRAVEP